MSPNCKVETADESHIPVEWRSSILGQVTLFKGASPFRSCYTERDFCVLDDDFSKEGEYVNLKSNPERFTGYAGESAAKIWNAIYNENCFSAPFMKNLCTEKQAFYKLISGLHASISTHICLEHLDQASGKWAPDVECYKKRLQANPEHVQNMYFIYTVVMKAVVKLGPYLENYTFCGDDEKVNEIVKEIVKNVIDASTVCPYSFHETQLFNSPDAPLLKEEFKLRFRNITRIMDCVDCQKCRLWGKLQVTGLGTALKILFSFDEKAFLENQSFSKDLFQRSEIVALFNLFGRLSESISGIEYFENLTASRQFDFSKDLSGVFVFIVVVTTTMFFIKRTL